MARILLVVIAAAGLFGLAPMAYCGTEAQGLLQVERLVSGMVAGEVGMLARQVGIPLLERVFSLRALLGVIGTGLLSLLFFVPFALLSEWFVSRRKSDRQSR